MEQPEAADVPPGGSAAIKQVGALVSGLAILRYLVRVGEPAGVTQVARELGLNTSTCFNLLKTLVSERLVTFHQEKKAYSIGLGFVELAKGTLEEGSYASLIRPHLDELVASHAVTITLWQRSGDNRVVLVDRVDSNSAIRVHMAIGQRLPLYIAALGRAMAATSGLSRADLRQRFAQLRWQNPPTFDQYYAEVEEAAKKGYAVDRDHYVVGVTTISAPIVTNSGFATMAISAVGFSGQFTGSMIEDIGADLRRCASEISGMLSATGIRARTAA